MVGCHSHKDCNSTHNRPKTADAVLKIWSTRINRLRQWSTVCCSRISKILLEKWNLTHPYCTLSPSIEGPGGTRCANIQERLYTRNFLKGLWKIAWLDLCCKICYHATQNHWTLSSRTTVRKKAMNSSGRGQT